MSISSPLSNAYTRLRNLAGRDAQRQRDERVRQDHGIRRLFGANRFGLACPVLEHLITHDPLYGIEMNCSILKILGRVLCSQLSPSLRLRQCVFELLDCLAKPIEDGILNFRRVARPPEARHRICSLV